MKWVVSKFQQAGYPNTIFLSSLDARPAPLSGYMKPKEVEAPLKYSQKEKANRNFREFNRN